MTPWDWIPLTTGWTCADEPVYLYASYEVSGENKAAIYTLAVR
eukprot:COSAG01_NODE_49887_length_368_cov_0.773234_1_plen_43_part_00